MSLQDVPYFGYSFAQLSVCQSRKRAQSPGLNLEEAAASGHSRHVPCPTAVARIVMARVRAAAFGYRRSILW